MALDNSNKTPIKLLFPSTLIPSPKINNKAPDKPTKTPKILRPVIGSLRNNAAKSMVIIGVMVNRIPVSITEERDNPSRKAN